MTAEDAVLERHKAILEYLKHLATVSTGSIVIIATFLTKTPGNTHYKGAVLISLIGFVAAVMLSIVYYSLALYYFPGVAELKEGGYWGTVMTVSLILAWVGLSVGLISLSVFAIGNL